MKLNPEIVIDLHKDWISILTEQLKNFGYKIDNNLSKYEISIRYFNIINRKFFPKPRKIFLSKEFNCPSEYQFGLNVILKKAKDGEDLLPHQSEKIFDADYNNYLFNDWDIHHLHLGIEEWKNGLLNRTGPVLFVKITNDSFYCIDILQHGKGHYPWVKKRLIGIIDHNWPELIEADKVVLKNIGDDSQVSSEREIGEFRKANLCYFFSTSKNRIIY